MSIINFIGQILLGAPFVVFAYWYEREEALFQSKQTYPRTIYRHAAFGLFFSVSFAILGMLFFPPIMGTTVLLSGQSARIVEILQQVQRAGALYRGHP